LPRNLLNCKTISIKRQVKKVLITFGGSDPQNFTSKVIKLLDLHKNFFKNINEIMLHIGSENIKKEEVKALADRSSLKLNLVSEIKDFSSLMEESDLAICSGGNTMYELCYLGIPSIVLPQNNHQRNFSSELNKYGYLKIVNVNVSDFENTFISTLLDLLNDYSLRKEYNQKSTNLFDGLGLDRISERIIDIQNK
jgi:spore coat polysaccharide biosynthesis predicted glycosyltransferase SpsG